MEMILVSTHLVVDYISDVLLHFLLKGRILEKYHIYITKNIEKQYQQSCTVSIIEFVPNLNGFSGAVRADRTHIYIDPLLVGFMRREFATALLADVTHAKLLTRERIKHYSHVLQAFNHLRAGILSVTTHIGIIPNSLR
jgi:hypothetical protein